MENVAPTKPPAVPDDSKKTIEKPAVVQKTSIKPVEIGGPKGPEPTRYGDWEKAGRCTDF